MKIEEYMQQLRAKTFCCPTMRKLRLDAEFANFSIDWDTKIMQPFGTFEGENYECAPFKMICCMFCGAKL